MISRRNFVQSGLACGFMTALPPLSRAEELKLIRMGIAFKAMSPAVISLCIPEQLGFTKAAGVTLQTRLLGNSTNVLIGLDRGEIDIQPISTAFFLPMMAKQQVSSLKLFYEYTYPYKWDIAVRPDSPIKAYEELKGKVIGVSSLGLSDYPVTRAVLRDLNVDPDGIRWVAVGEGATAGFALQRGDIDALAYFDTGFGAIENAGIVMRYLPRPAKVPMIGGLFLSAREEFIEKNRDICVAYGRAVSMASLFITENPAAAAHAWLEMYPDTAPRNLAKPEAVQSIVRSINRRIPLLLPPYPGGRIGEIFESELVLEAQMTNLKIDNYKSYYTNDLIGDINRFDREAVIKAARSYQF